MVSKGQQATTKMASKIWECSLMGAQWDFPLKAIDGTPTESLTYLQLLVPVRPKYKFQMDWDPGGLWSSNKLQQLYLRDHWVHTDVVLRTWKVTACAVRRHHFSQLGLGNTHQVGFLLQHLDVDGCCFTLDSTSKSVDLMMNCSAL